MNQPITRTRNPDLRTDIDLFFADGAYRFFLPIPQVMELEQKCGMGIGAIFGKVLRGSSVAGDDVLLDPGAADFSAIQVVEVVRQGLIGGGKGTVDGVDVKVTPIVANRLITNYLLNRPLSEAWELAVAILAAAVLGHDPNRKPAPVAA